MKWGNGGENRPQWRSITALVAFAVSAAVLQPFAPTTATASVTNYSLFADYVPAATPVFDNPTELAVSASTSAAGQITAIRFYQYWNGTNGNIGAHTGYVWSGKRGDPSNTKLATKRFPISTDTPTVSGWVEVSLDTPIAIAAGETFTVSVSNTNGFYTRDSKPGSKTVGPLSLLGTSFRYYSDGLFPHENSGTNYGIDFVFATSSPPENSSLPTVSGTTRVGSTLTANQGTWSGTPTYTYQWQNSASATGTFTNIAFATSSTYVPKGESLGKYVRVNVTATDGGGSTTVSSAASAEILTASATPGTPCHLGGPCAIGDIGPGSGVVFYLSSAGFACGPTLAGTCNYLEAARDYWNNLVDDYASGAGAYFYDQRNPKGLIGLAAQGTAIGAGYRNTRAAISFPLDSSNRAVHVADSYSVNPFGIQVDDWYLPSKDELLALYSNRPNNLLSFPPGGYWSSTETDASQVGEVNFSNGAWNPNYATFNYSGVRPVRAFASTLTVPAIPTLTAVTGGDRSLSLSVTAGSDGGSVITGYKYSLNGETFTVIMSTTSPLIITSLIGRRSYSVRIKAVNAIGDSESTTALSATTIDAALDASEAAAESARLAALAEAARLADLAAEAARKAEIEERRLAGEAKKAEELKKLEEQKAEELKKLEQQKAEELKKLEEQKKAEEKKAEELKKIEELKKAEAKKLADEKKAEDAKKAEEEKAKLAAEAKVQAEETRREQEQVAATVGTAEVVSKAEAAAEIAGSGAATATVETIALKGKHLSSALSAGGNKVALRLTGLKIGTKIKIKLKRSVK